MLSKRALKSAKGSSNEYSLNEESESVWITVDTLSVYVCRTEEGVVVDIFVLDKESLPPIASTYAFFGEGLD